MNLYYRNLFLHQVQITMYQRELSSVMLQKHDLERQLDVEHRLAHALQMQLEVAMKATQRSDADRDAFAQKANRNEVQLLLSTQEIGILREECKKLEVEYYQE